jgi:type III secretion system YscD/HrpQ family protein
MYLIAEKGLLSGLQLKFTEGEEWILGRDPNQVTFLLADPSLAERAVRVTKTPEELFFIENLGAKESLLVNGRPVEEPLLLSDQDRVEIGKTTFRFALDPSLPESPYDDIFGSLEDPEILPEPEPIAEKRAASREKENPLQSAYDTIFEDSSGEIDLPFERVKESKAPLLLKVLAGPNAGAEIGLEKGRSYLLGKDPDSCDIVFHDLSVSRNHARLTISSEGILDLEDLDSKNGTVINGSRLTERSAITTQHLIQMGTTIFLIIDREAPQETIYAPPPYEPPKTHTPEEIATVLEKAEELQEASLDWKSRKIPGKQLVFAGSFLLIFFIISVTFFSLFRSDRVEFAHKMPHEHLNELFAKAPSVQYSFNPATGKLFMTGHQLTLVDHQELLYNVRQVPSVTSVENTIVIDETVSKMMNDLLSTNLNWRAVSVLPTKPGLFVVRGYVSNLDQVTQLADFFTANFPYGERLENRVAIEEAMNAEIVNLLQSKGFGTVIPQLANGEVLLAGRYSEKQKSEYKEFLSQLSQIPGVVIVKNSAVPVSPLAASIISLINIK